MNKRFSLILTLILLPLFCISQVENKFHLRLEASPSFSKIKPTELFPSEYILCFNAHLNVEFPLSSKVTLLTGIGVLNTGEKRSKEIDFMDIDKTKTRNDFYFVSIPLGIKYYINRFFISPQASISIFVYDREKHTVFYQDGEVETERRRVELYDSDFNRITFPLILSLGKEFNIGKTEYLLGARAYYSMNELITNTPLRSNKYFGLGLLFGVKLK